LSRSGKGFFVGIRTPLPGAFFYRLKLTMRKSIIYILVLIASLWPAPARGDEPQVASAICRAVNWLHGQQLDDGSFGLRRPDQSAMPSASVTADAVYVLALLGENPAGPAWTRGGRSALDALAALAPGYVGEDAGQAGKVARAVALAGGDPHDFAGLDLIAIIQAAYDPANGRYHPTFLFRHTLAIEGLLHAGEPVPPAALDVLLAARRPDGSWFWAFEGTNGDVDSTGRVMQLLASQGGLRCAAVLDPTAEYLTAAQEAEGWGVRYLPGPANANSTALAIAGLQAAGYDLRNPRFQKAGRHPVEMLLAFQEPGGAFLYSHEPGREESRLVATLDTLSALAQLQGNAPRPDRTQIPVRGHGRGGLYVADNPSPCRWFYLPVPLF
jgi:hypothetical protein